MTIIKEIKKGNWRLTHSRYFDGVILRDGFSMQATIAGGQKINFSFYPMLKPVEGDPREANLYDATQEFNDADYEAMFEENRKKFKEHYPDVI